MLMAISETTGYRLLIATPFASLVILLLAIGLYILIHRRSR